MVPAISAGLDPSTAQPAPREADFSFFDGPQVRRQ